MAAGRPPRGTSRPTRLIRVSEDLADKLSWIAEFGDDVVAEIVDPLIRPEVERRYEQIESRVEIIKTAKAEATAIHAPELGEAGA